VIEMVTFEKYDIDSLRFVGLSGNITIYKHDKNTIDIISEHEDKLSISENDGIVSVLYNDKETESIKKNFIEKIFKRSYKLNIPLNSSYVEDRNEISIYPLLYVNIDVYVPKSIIDYVYVEGNATLKGEGFSDYIRIYTNGDNTIKIGEVKNIYIDSQGKLECFLDETNNSCLYINGKSFIRLNGKHLKSLKLKSKGELELDAVGSIVDLNVDVSGTSSINIYGKVTNKIINKKGICQITISN
jgi:hypothetical protein